MKKLGLEIGDYVRVESIAIPKGIFVQVRLLDKALLEIRDVKSAYIFPLL